jgi:hypothetical protein
MSAGNTIDTSAELCQPWLDAAKLLKREWLRAGNQGE